MQAKGLLSTHTCKHWTRRYSCPAALALPPQVAINGELLATMSNINYAAPGGMLDTWMESVARAGVKNAMVIALDPATKANAEAKGFTAHEMHVKVGRAPCAAVSAAAHMP